MPTSISENPPLPPTPPILGDTDEYSEAPPSPSHSGMEGDEEEFQEDFSFSFGEAVDRLAAVSPDSVGAAPETASSLSAAERALGGAPTKSSPSLCLKESTMVAEVFHSTLAKTRGNAEPPAVGSVPAIPSALPCGHFLTMKNLKSPFKKRPVLGDSFPTSFLPVTQEDMLLLGEDDRNSNSPRSFAVKDKVLAEWELLAAKGLESVSVMDSFLGGLVSSIKDPSSSSFAVREEVDTADVVSFVRTISDSLKFAASSFASLQVNLTLCRRDAILSRSPVLKKSPSTLASLRVVPVRQASLFGGDHISPTIHSLAETRRDLAFVIPRQPAKPHIRPQARDSQKPHRASSRPSRSPTRGGKTSASRKPNKPYERSKAPKAEAKPHPQ